MPQSPRTPVALKGANARGSLQGFRVREGIKSSQ